MRVPLLRDLESPPPRVFGLPAAAAAEDIRPPVDTPTVAWVTGWACFSRRAKRRAGETAAGRGHPGKTPGILCTSTYTSTGGHQAGASRSHD